MSRFQISAEEYEAIKAAEKRVKDKKTSKRLRILMLRYEGYKVAEIAKMYGTRKEWISQICRKYREQGLEECNTICDLTNDMVKSITCRQWIADAFLI